MEQNIHEIQNSQGRDEANSKEDLSALQAIAMTVVSILAVTLGTIYGSIL